MLSLDKAKENAFQSATPAELRAFCDQLGIKHDGRHKDKTLIQLLCNELGIANLAVPQPKRAELRVVSKGEILPPYNLTPNGIWGGRRHRVRLLRPEGVKIAGGVVFNWNGKPYAMAYNEVSNIPEPFFNILRGTIKRSATSVAVDVGEGVFERHIEFRDAGEKYPYTYLGVDEETKDRCGSLKEWYQQKGPAWFRERSRREIDIIARTCDIPTVNRRDEPLTDEELTNNVVQFFFSYADAESVESEAA